MIGKVLVALTLVLLTERSDAASLSAVDILTGNEELSQNNKQEVIKLTKLSCTAHHDFGGNASNFDEALFVGSRILLKNFSNF